MQVSQRDQEIGEQFIGLVREFPVGTPVYTSFGEVGLVVGYHRTRAKQVNFYEDEEVVFQVEVKIVGRFESLEEQTTVRLGKHQIQK